MKRASRVGGSAWWLLMLPAERRGAILWTVLFCNEVFVERYELFGWGGFACVECFQLKKACVYQRLRFSVQGKALS